MNKRRLVLDLFLLNDLCVLYNKQSISLEEHSLYTLLVLQ